MADLTWAVDALAERCPDCRRRLGAGLDVCGDQLEWQPCCDAAVEAGQVAGWFERLSGDQRRQLIWALTGQATREVHADHETWRALWPLQLVQISQREAFDFIARHHRHHKPPRGWKYGLGVRSGHAGLVAVAVIGRPVNRHLQGRGWLEVTRLCTVPDLQARHAASMLYAAAARRAKSLGAPVICTYMLADESGISAKAAGYVATAKVRGRSWGCVSRPRADVAPTCDKVRFERQLAAKVVQHAA